MGFIDGVFCLGYASPVQRSCSDSLNRVWRYDMEKGEYADVVRSAVQVYSDCDTLSEFHVCGSDDWTGVRDARDKRFDGFVAVAGIQGCIFEK